MAKVGKELALWVASGLIIRGIIFAVKNRMDGKDILGRKLDKKPPKKTHMDWRGNIVLGKDDFRVEAA